MNVIVIDKNPNAIGMKKADIAFAIDVLDKEKAIDIDKRYNIDGVITTQTDLPVPTIGAVIGAFLH